jgi:chromosome segregation ATPase
MARQLEESLHALERTDELPVLSADAVRKFENTGQTRRPESGDGLDRSLDTLRQALEDAEIRWRQLESRLEAQDRAIRRLQAVPELTEMVAHRTGLPAEIDLPAPDGALEPQAREQALLERIAALEAFIAGQHDHLQALETELGDKTRRIAELEASRDAHQ